MEPDKLNQSLLQQVPGENGGFGADESDNDYLYDRYDVRAVCIILYSIVFIACFLGNSIVIIVVTVHWRMRSITNFCLANLAFADFCVSIFCVYQNMYIYFMSSWVFGAFLCKMYYFITELSHTASILILVVICIERYLAIVHPMRCKEWLTLTRLRITIIGVWGTSALYSSPRLYFTNIGTMSMRGGDEEILCIPIRTLYDSETFDMISLAVLFVLPLLVISVLYTRIGLALWESSKNQMQQPLTYYPHGNGMTGGGSGIGPPLESCSSSERDCEREVTNFRGFSKHSCTDILCGCCSCDPCQVRYSGSRKSQSLLRNKNRRRGSEYHRGHCPLKPPTAAPEENGQRGIEQIVVVKFENGSPAPKGKRGGRNTRCTISFNGNANAKPETTANGSANLNLNSINDLPRLAANGVRSQNMPAPTKLRRMTVTRGVKYGSRALESRRRIIKMLIIIVVSFAVCNLPFHARKLWQYYGAGYYGGSTFSSIFTPVTFLIMYANSGINPILYAFMSKKFRLCFMDLVNCKLRRSLCVARNASVRSTHIVPLSTPPP